MDSRLRVARGIAENETLASVEVFRKLKRHGHPDGPPPTISDGWGGIDEAMIEINGAVLEYSGQGRPPTKKRARPGWQYLQMVKQRDERGRVDGIELRVQFGKKSEAIALLGKSTAYIDRSNLTSRLFNGRQVRKTLAFRRMLQPIKLPRSGKTATTTWSDRTKACGYRLQMARHESGCHER